MMLKIVLKKTWKNICHQEKYGAKKQYKICIAQIYKKKWVKEQKNSQKEFKVNYKNSQAMMSYLGMSWSCLPSGPPGGPEPGLRHLV